MIIFGGSASPDLAGKVASQGNYESGKIEIKQFPDSEIYVRILSDVESEECVVVQSVQDNDKLIELLIILDALKDSGAKKVTAVIPYLAYARQDKRFNKGEALTARTILKLINNLSDRIITVNCHFLNKEGIFDVSDYFDVTSRFFEKGVKSDTFDSIDFNKKIKDNGRLQLAIENLDAFSSVAKYFKNKFSKFNENLVVIAPDKGALQHAKLAADVIGCQFDYLEKTRISGDEVKIETKNPDVSGMNVLILDDMISTGGTIVESAKVIKNCGAKTINVGCVHGVFSKGTKMFEEFVDELVCTNTLSTEVSKIDVSGLIAENL